MTKPTTTRRARRRARESDVAAIATLATERAMKPITQARASAVIGFMLTGGTHLLLEPDERSGTRISLVDRSSSGASVFAGGFAVWMFGGASVYVWLESTALMLALSLFVIALTIPTAWIMTKRRARVCAELLDAIEARLS